ncbi:Phosphoglycerate transporter protein [compost metagenome]
MRAAYERNKLADAGSIRTVFFICWITYTSTYIGRLNFNASMGEMMTSDHFSKSQLGLVAAAFFFAYGIGQFISGILGDRVSPKLLVFLGLSSSSALNLAMGISSTYEMMVILWSLNGLAQSLTWSPMAKLIADRLPKKESFRALAVLTTTVPAGTLITYLMCSLLIDYSGWRMVFDMAAFLMLPVAVVWYIVISKLEHKADSGGFTEQSPALAATGTPSPPHHTPLYTLFAVSGLLFIGMGAMLHGILKDGIMTWMPTYLAEGYHTGSSLAIRLTMILPVINLAGVYLSGVINRKIFQNELVTAAALFALTVLALLVLIGYGKNSLPLALLMLGIVTSAMLGVNAMLVSFVPVYFRESGRVSTVSGLLNSATYVGSALSSYGIGAVAEQLGWGFTRLSWCVLALGGAVICVIASGRWRAFTRKI